MSKFRSYDTLELLSALDTTRIQLAGVLEECGRDPIDTPLFDATLATMEMHRRLVQHEALRLPLRAERIRVADNYQDTFGHTIDLKGPGRHALERQLIVCDRRAGIMGYSNDPDPTQFDFNDLVLVQGSRPACWGAVLPHFYGSILRCLFTGIGARRDDDEPVDGHAVYWKLFGGVALIMDSTFLGCSGQALQIVARPHEGPVDDKAHVEIRGCLVQDCSWTHVGHGGGGGSNFTVSAATQHGTSVRIDDCTFVGTIGGRATAKHQAATRGAVTVYGEKATKANGFHFSDVRISGNTIVWTEADRHPYQVTHAKRILVDGIEGDIGEAFQRIDGVPVLLEVKTHELLEELVVNGVTFDCMVKVDGEPHLVKNGESFKLSY